MKFGHDIGPYLFFFVCIEDSGLRQGIHQSFVPDRLDVQALCRLVWLLLSGVTRVKGGAACGEDTGVLVVLQQRVVACPCFSFGPISVFAQEHSALREGSVLAAGLLVHVRQELEISGEEDVSLPQTYQVRLEICRHALGAFVLGGDDGRVDPLNAVWQEVKVGQQHVVMRHVPSEGVHELEAHRGQVQGVLVVLYRAILFRDNDIVDPGVQLLEPRVLLHLVPRAARLLILSCSFIDRVLAQLQCSLDKWVDRVFHLLAVGVCL
mmetsp:Transcript_13154/g.25497  ORF Transcript_13154/g.25497 Transcript_13154/m.25497 type:complete len:265 (-) Transcript_13154:446-1240(-)